MQYTKIEKRILDALQRDEPLPPIRHDLGGGYYYKCHWMVCNTDVNRFMNFCPGCGQRLRWGDEQ